MKTEAASDIVKATAAGGNPLAAPRRVRTLDETIELFCDAWNRHAAEELAAMWSDDGELNHPWGYRRVGRDQIRELLVAEHAGSMASSNLTVRNIDTQSDRENISADIDAVLTGVRAPNGREYELPHVMSALFVRSGDEWKIRSMTPVANPRRRS